ncbi:MAG TPA: NAD(P)-binding domain-containing protein [Candidatus Limnocylindrales bacterium]|nr:NAD(P)-binding domain-containing protein [Candidatus Limnocylindrales bacterium]
MSDVAADIRAVAATAPDVPHAARQLLEAAILPAAKRHGGAVIRTCHRVEWYREGPEDPRDLLVGHGAVIPDGTTIASGLDAVGRLVTVSLGLDSVVLGEDQILHQVRQAVIDARAAGPFGGELAFAFDAALHAGRLGRTWRSVRSQSIADVAIARAVSMAGPARDRRVLVVGTGEMGRLAVRAAQAAGADVALASRNGARSREAAATLGVAPWPTDPGLLLADVAIVLIALGGTWDLRPESVRALTAGPVVVDLSMPAALSADVVAALGRRSIGIDDLAVAEVDTASSPVRAGEDARYRDRLVGLRDRTIETFRVRAEARRAAGAARALAATVERERHAALAALFRGRPDLAPRDQAAIEAMTVRLTDRLFGSALERLAADGDGPDGRAVRQVFDL